MFLIFRSEVKTTRLLCTHWFFVLLSFIPRGKLLIFLTSKQCIRPIVLISLPVCIPAGYSGSLRIPIKGQLVYDTVSKTGNLCVSPLMCPSCILNSLCQLDKPTASSTSTPHSTSSSPTMSPSSSSTAATETTAKSPTSSTQVTPTTEPTEMSTAKSTTPTEAVTTAGGTATTEESETTTAKSTRPTEAVTTTEGIEKANTVSLS